MSTPIADTAEFAVESIRRWWTTMGRQRFPNVTKLLITADAGGSNGYRVRAWLASPPTPGSRSPSATTPLGTAKWNKIEHRLFSFISIYWRGRLLTDIHTIVELIAATTTTTRLSVQAAYDPNWYPTGEKITNADYATIPLTAHDWHGEWNFTINTTAA